MKYKQILAILISFFVCLFTIDIWLPVGVSVNYEISCDKILELEVFWGAKSEEFNQQKRHKLLVGKGESDVEFFIPTEKLERLRLDFGRSPGHITIRNVEVVGQNDEFLNNINLFEWRHICSIANETEGFQVTSNHADPYIFTKSPLNVKGKRGKILFWNFFLIAGASFYLCLVIINIITKKEKSIEKLPPLLNIEFLRILFTLGVLNVHFRFGVFGLHSTGGQGVEFFFVLSGYLLALTFHPEKSIFNFAKSRYLRFVPLIVFGGILAGAGEEAFLGLFMIQNTGMVSHDLANGPAWYISILFWCSIFYLFIMKSLNRSTSLLIIGSITFISLILVANLDGEARMAIMKSIPLTRGLLRGLSCMGLGIMLSQICKRTIINNKNAYSTIRWIPSLLEIGILAYIIVGCFNPNYAYKHWVYQPILHAVLIYLFVTKKGLLSTITERPLFAKLSKYCLGVYLTHFFFFTTVKKIVRVNYPGWLDEHMSMSLWIAFVGSLALGILSHYLVEKPCSKHLQLLNK